MNELSSREHVLYGAFIVSLLLTALIIGTILKIIYEKQSTLRNGVKTIAEIENIEQSPGGKGGNINIKISISFSTRTGETIRTSRISRVPILNVERYKKGNHIEIIYNEKKPNKIIFSNSN